MLKLLFAAILSLAFVHIEGHREYLTTLPPALGETAALPCCSSGVSEIRMMVQCHVPRARINAVVSCFLKW